MKSLYLGSVTLVIGFLIAFQVRRTLRLVGSMPAEVTMARRIQAGILAVLLSLTLFPLFIERVSVADQFEKTWTHEVVLPIAIVLGLFTAAMMSALAIEKRKR